MTCENFSIGRRQPNSERYTPDALLVAKIEGMIDSIAPKHDLRFDALTSVSRSRNILYTDEYGRVSPYSYPELEYRVVRGLSVPVVLVAPERVSDSMHISRLSGRTPGIEISAYSEIIGEHRIRVKKSASCIKPEMGFTDYPGFTMEYMLSGESGDGSPTVRTQKGRFASVDEYGPINGPLKKNPSYSALVILVDVIGRKDHAGFSSGLVEFTGFAIAENPRSYRQSLLVYLKDYQKYHSLPVEFIMKAEEMLWRNPPDFELRGRVNTLVAAVMEPEVDSPKHAAGDLLDVPLEELARDLHLQEEDIHPAEPAISVIIPRARKIFTQALQAVSANQEISVME